MRQAVEKDGDLPSREHLIIGWRLGHTLGMPNARRDRSWAGGFPDTSAGHLQEGPSLPGFPGSGSWHAGCLMLTRPGGGTMPTQAATGFSTQADTAIAVDESLRMASKALKGAKPSLGIVF